MCGRFITTGTWAEYRRYMNILPPDVDGRNGPEPNYNVAPTTTLDIITSNKDGEIAIEPVRWGLIPHWAKDAKKVRMQINARGETVMEKPFFRTSFQYGRCLIPATGYYEWLTRAKDDKQPYLIHLDGQPPSFEPFAFAGIMSRNHELETTTFAIVTLDADPAVAHIHNRMPVIFKGDVLAKWLDGATSKEAAHTLLQDNRGADLVYHPVAKDVGAVKNKGPELIDPVPIT